MLEESLRLRLEALNREQLPRMATAPRVGSATAEQRPQRRANSVPKRAGLLARGRAVSNSFGEHLTVTLPVAEIWPAGDALLGARHEELKQQCDERPSDCAQFLAAFPSRLVALDLETCGFSGSALFLVGLVRHVDSQFVVELLLARNYAEEAAVLCSLGERLTGADALVTFNGKSFDWPMVADRWVRYLMHRTSPLPKLVHYDVLHHARRRWRGKLPDCKLQTIERMICRRSRTGDIPGHMIPGAYDHYVRTGNPNEIEQVLYHNAVDLVTLLDVAMRLAG